MMDYNKKFESWLASDFVEDHFKAELSMLKANCENKEIEDRFYRNLEFGTGGLRGIIGAGTNRMNIYTIRKATAGFGNYLMSKYQQAEWRRGVVIAYDTRNLSDVFAKEVAQTLASKGIKVYLFDDVRPTPELSFAVRYLNALAGIVITASHNPPEYNGYKIYGEDGGQITLQAASDIIDHIESLDDLIELDSNHKTELILEIGDEMDHAYYAAVLKSSYLPKMFSDKKNTRILFTPLHGTGAKPIPEILRLAGYQNVLLVNEQMVPDPAFSTVNSPNPEERAAFDLAINKACEMDCDLIIGTDPDADRMGVVTRNSNGDYIVLNGNQSGALILYYLLKFKQENNLLPIKPAVVKTIVTSDLGERIARSFECEVFNTLTGFKYIGEKITEFDHDQSYNYIFGYEESYGYLSGTHARDKDAVEATLLIADAYSWFKSRGLSLLEGLNEIYSTYGFYQEHLKSYTLKGRDGLSKMVAIMTEMRKLSIGSQIGGSSIREIMDYKNGLNGLPSSDVLKIIYEDTSWVAIRPSGTEPKLKIYMSAKGVSLEDCTQKIKMNQAYFDEVVERLS